MKKIRWKNVSVKTAAFAVLYSVMLSGCAKEEVYDSNTTSVKNTPYREPAEVTETPIYESMQNIKLAVTDILEENYWPDRLLSKEEFFRETGIEEELYDEFLAENISIGTDIDMLFVVLAKEDKVAEVEKAFNDYRNKLIRKYERRPQRHAKASASRIEVIDKYVCYVQLGADTTKVAPEGSEKVLLFCQQENERAIDAIEKEILE